MEDKILPFLDDICLCSLYIAKISQISSKIGRYLFVLNNLPHMDDLWPSKTFQFWNATIPVCTDSAPLLLHVAIATDPILLGPPLHLLHPCTTIHHASDNPHPHRASQTHASHIPHALRILHITCAPCLTQKVMFLAYSTQ